jgi:hypothetical protein
LNSPDGAPAQVEPQKIYFGIRHHSGVIVGVLDPSGAIRTLPARHDLFNHSPTGFEWGYHGSGPAQLALAILADLLKDDRLAVSFHQDFKRRVVALCQRDHWFITAEEAEAFVDIGTADRNGEMPF